MITCLSQVVEAYRVIGISVAVVVDSVASVPGGGVHGKWGCLTGEHTSAQMVVHIARYFVETALPCTFATHFGPRLVMAAAGLIATHIKRLPSC